MRFLPEHIFSEFKHKILEDSYYPTDPVEALKARLMATCLLQDIDPFIIEQAKAFIHKTSTFKEVDLAYLQEFSSHIQAWEELQICSISTKINSTFLEYKLSFTTKDNHKKTVHFHAQYKMEEGAWFFISQTAPLIRLVGDPILHKPGIFFPINPTLEEKEALATQIEQAKSALIKTGGVGIAANQCAEIEEPYCLTIVGVFYDIEEHALSIQGRYPDTRFPQATIMVNPVITAVSKEKQSFNHGCLSVPCANRCAVLSPMEISVSYQDPMDEMKVKLISFSGADAVVLWHELTHILDGKTYMDVTFESLSFEDLLLFQKMLKDEMSRRMEGNTTHIPKLTVPPFHFSVKLTDLGSLSLDKEELLRVLPNMTDETLGGLSHQANSVKKKFYLSNDIKKSAYRMFFEPKDDEFVSQKHEFNKFHFCSAT